AWSRASVHGRLHVGEYLHACRKPLCLCPRPTKLSLCRSSNKGLTAPGRFLSPRPGQRVCVSQICEEAVFESLWAGGSAGCLGRTPRCEYYRGRPHPFRRERMNPESGLYPLVKL